MGVFVDCWVVYVLFFVRLFEKELKFLDSCFKLQVLSSSL